MMLEVGNMTKTKIFAILALAMVMLSGALSAAISVGAYTVTPSTLKPGEEGAISFSISNVAPSATITASQLENVQVFFGGTVEGLQFTSTSPFNVGTIDSGSTAQVSVAFRVLPTAKGGAITAPFYISQKDKTDLKTVNAIVHVVNPPVITVTSDHQTVLGTDEINLTVRNDGGKATRLRVSIASGSNFSFIGTSQIYIGDLSGSTTVAVPLDSRNVEEGVSNIPFVLTYQQEGGNETTETKYLSVAVKKEKADVIFTQAEKMVTGRDNTLVLTVKNTGRSLANLEFYLEDAKIQAKENKQVKLGNMATGDERKISLRVFVNAEPGVRSMQVRLKWSEDDVDKEETTYVPVVINSDADAAIYIDAKPSPIVVGGDHTLSITVSNVGSYKIQNVEVTLADSPDFEIFNAQRSQYIGGLESDDFSSVQYKVRVKALVPGQYPLTVNVKYKDQSGVWVEKKQEINISIRSPSDILPANGNGNTLPLAIGGLAVLAAGYWYFRMRKRKPLSQK
jgi:LPXTG-motif cell wall-anchored protein